MKIDDKIRNEKWQYDTNREAAKIVVLSSGKIDKYEYLTGEEVLCFYKRQIIEEAKFTCFPLQKQIKSIEEQRKSKQMLLWFKTKD